MLYQFPIQLILCNLSIKSGSFFSTSLAPSHACWLTEAPVLQSINQAREIFAKRIDNRDIEKRRVVDR